MAKKKQGEIDYKAFLRELSALTLKYRVSIGGCGCCGSPRLSELEKKVTAGSYTTSDSHDDLTFRT
jgi:hypothetical protein